MTVEEYHGVEGLECIEFPHTDRKILEPRYEV